MLNGLFTYEENKWNKITIYIYFGNSKIKSTYDIEVIGEKKTWGEINYTTLTNFKIIIIETKNDTFMDDLTVKTDYEIQNFFRNIYNQNADIFGKIKYEKLIEIKNDKN